MERIHDQKKDMQAERRREVKGDDLEERVV